MNPFFAINMTFLGALLGATTLYLSALATGTLTFTPQHIAPIAATCSASIAFFITTHYLHHHLNKIPPRHVPGAHPPKHPHQYPHYVSHNTILSAAMHTPRNPL